MAAEPAHPSTARPRFLAPYCCAPFFSMRPSPVPPTLPLLSRACQVAPPPIRDPPLISPRSQENITNFAAGHGVGSAVQSRPLCAPHPCARLCRPVPAPQCLTLFGQSLQVPRPPPTPHPLPLALPASLLPFLPLCSRARLANTVQHAHTRVACAYRLPAKQASAQQAGCRGGRAPHGTHALPPAQIQVSGGVCACSACSAKLRTRLRYCSGCLLRLRVGARGRVAQ